MSARVRSVTLIVLAGACVALQMWPAVAQAPAPGGLIESALSTTVRPKLTAQLQPLLPARGPFNFPAPYNTAAVRLTADTDCANSSDCLWPVNDNSVQYMSNSAGSNFLYVAVAFETSRGGLGPSLIRYHKITGETVNLGPMFDLSDGRSAGNMTGWHFSATLPTALYIPSRGVLQRFDVLTHATTQVFDATNVFGVEANVVRPYSSNDDTVHSWIVAPRAGGDFIGCGVYRANTAGFTLFQPNGHLHTCQVDRSGNWLLIKEDPYGTGAVDNRIINLTTNAQTTLIANQGSSRMSDIGFGAMVGDDWSMPIPQAYRIFNFGVGPGPLVYRDPPAVPKTMTEISFANAKPGALDNQFACGAALHRSNGPRANEIVCVRLDGSLDTLVVAPVMTDLDAAGGRTDDLKQPHGIVDPTGRYFLWYSNVGSTRLDAFLVSLPIQLLVSVPEPPGPEISNVIATNVTATSATISWNTTQPANGLVEYGLTNAYGLSAPLDSALTMTHTRLLTGLQSGKTYHYRVTSTNSDGVSRTSADLTFTTRGGLVISDVSVSSISPRDAVVRWKTNQPASSIVDFGTTTGYGSSARMPGNPTNHAVLLRGLSPRTVYHFRVRSQNAAGVTSTSPDWTFETLAPSVQINRVAVKHITNDTATITWTTEEKTKGYIEYGTTNNYGQATDLSRAFTVPHLHTLRGLSPNTVYHYRIVAVDRDGGTTYSRDFVFRTARR